MSTPMETVQVLLFADPGPTQVDVCGLLERLRWKVTVYPIAEGQVESLVGAHLVLIDASGQTARAMERCRGLHERIKGTYLPVLMILDEATPAARLASFAAGADTYVLRPYIDEELLAQIRALLRTKEIHERLAERNSEIHRINKSLQVAYQQIDQELELAQRIQASFLPQNLPDVPQVRFAVHYLLCGRVGGDFYDIFRLDERHVGFYVADAMGHGVPASLLTIFVKKGVRPKDVFGSQYRLVPPDEVLARLNRDLIDQQLHDQPFITMAYALFNHQDGTLQLARAGHPYPIHVPKSGAVNLWKQEGLLIGVVDAKYSCTSHQLAVGDKLLFYSDGVDSAAFEGCEPGVPSLFACAQRHRHLPIQEFLTRLVRDLFGTGPQPDDLTLLGLERSE